MKEQCLLGFFFFVLVRSGIIELLVHFLELLFKTSLLRRKFIDDSFRNITVTLRTEIRRQSSMMRHMLLATPIASHRVTGTALLGTCWATAFNARNRRACRSDAFLLRVTACVAYEDLPRVVIAVLHLLVLLAELRPRPVLVATRGVLALIRSLVLGAAVGRSVRVTRDLRGNEESGHCVHCEANWIMNVASHSGMPDVPSLKYG